MQLAQEVEPVLTFVAKHGEAEIEKRSLAFSMTRSGEWKEIGFMSPPSAHEEGVLPMVKRTNQFLVTKSHNNFATLSTHSYLTFFFIAIFVEIEKLNAISISDSWLENQQVKIPNTDIRVKIFSNSFTISLLKISIAPPKRSDGFGP